ncbi:MAG: type II toxin-antitoxin system VapB family antitoxin [Geminicoccaceae bacterium]
MGLFIRYDSVRDMAERLAEARRTTVTEAVRQALEREIERDLKERDRRIRESWARLDAMPRSDITSDRDLYDDEGNPVL